MEVFLIWLKQWQKKTRARLSQWSQNLFIKTRQLRLKNAELKTPLGLLSDECLKSPTFGSKSKIGCSSSLKLKPSYKPKPPSDEKRRKTFVDRQTKMQHGGVEKMT